MTLPCVQSDSLIVFSFLVAQGATFKKCFCITLAYFLKPLCFSRLSGLCSYSKRLNFLNLELHYFFPTPQKHIWNFESSQVDPLVQNILLPLFKGKTENLSLRFLPVILVRYILFTELTSKASLLLVIRAHAVTQTKARGQVAVCSRTF